MEILDPTLEKKLDVFPLDSTINKKDSPIFELNRLDIFFNRIVSKPHLKEIHITLKVVKILKISNDKNIVFIYYVC